MSVIDAHGFLLLTTKYTEHAGTRQRIRGFSAPHGGLGSVLSCFILRTYGYANPYSCLDSDISCISWFEEAARTVAIDRRPDSYPVFRRALLALYCESLLARVFR
jgi:hypothetical protein